MPIKRYVAPVHKIKILILLSIYHRFRRLKYNTFFNCWRNYLSLIIHHQKYVILRYTKSHKISEKEFKDWISRQWNSHYYRAFLFSSLMSYFIYLFSQPHRHALAQIMSCSQVWDTTSYTRHHAPGRNPGAHAHLRVGTSPSLIRRQRPGCCRWYLRAIPKSLAAAKMTMRF